MMSDKTKKVYSEVYAFLNIVSEEDRNKIPKKLKEMIEEEREKEYTPSYTFEQIYAILPIFTMLVFKLAIY